MNLQNIVKKETPIIFEVGCNNGEDTVRLVTMFKSPVIHCFEPDEITYGQLLENVKPYGGKIIPNQLAISDTDGEITFMVANNSLSSSVKKPVKHLDVYPTVKFNTTKRVKSMRLDTYAKQHNISYCDFLWMDVQGAEDLVISGGKEFFKHTKYLYTEFSNIELYEGALGKEGILNLLPYFKLLEIIPEAPSYGNMLLVNTTM